MFTDTLSEENFTQTFDNSNELKDNKKKVKLSWKKICKKLPKLPSVLPAVPRIIAIGDIHGDFNKLLDSLKLANLIPNNTNEKTKKVQWIGNDTIVVQLGDQVDSCRYDSTSLKPCHAKGATKNDKGDDVKILRFMTELHRKALKKGGAIYSIMGNHELMNVDGNMAYVSHENIKAFDEYQEEYKKYVNPRKFKSAMEARKWAFSPGNPIANFLGCTRQAGLIIGSNLFVHAGILPTIAKKYGVEDLNSILTLYLWKKLKSPEKYSDVLGHQSSSPFWNRSFAKANIDQCNDLTTPLLETYEVNRLIVGHTPSLNGISSNCSDKVILADYGSSRAFDKYRAGSTSNVQVIEILNDNKINILS
jgi:hypothetical protein